MAGRVRARARVSVDVQVRVIQVDEYWLRLGLLYWMCNDAIIRVRGLGVGVSVEACSMKVTS